jgi:Zn-dependent protease with chaperone function
MKNITAISDCISKDEKKKQIGVGIINGIIWIFIIAMVVVSPLLLIYVLFFWGISYLTSEYNVRKVQALGTTVSQAQFPEIFEGLKSVCSQFNVEQHPRVILLNVNEINALAVKFARKKVIVLFSKTLEGIHDKPAEIKFFLGHEIAHIILDFGLRGKFEIFKTASFRAAREMTCDNCGLAASGSLEASISSMKRLVIGNELTKKVNVEYLIAEAKDLYSGFTGWMLRNNLRYPPFGKRIENLKTFYESN